jgi:hypothetical protein
MIARKTLLLTLLTGLITITFLAAQTAGSGPKIAITGIPQAGQGGPDLRKKFQARRRGRTFANFASSFMPLRVTNGGSSQRRRIR